MGLEINGKHVNLKEFNVESFSKGDVSSSFDNYSDQKITFKKKGAELKTILAAKKVALIELKNSVIVKQEMFKKQVNNDALFQNTSMDSIYIDGNIPYEYRKQMSDESQKCYDGYRDCIYKVQSIEKDIKVTDTLLSNLDDKGSYELNIRQMNSLQKSDISYAFGDNYGGTAMTFSKKGSEIKTMVTAKIASLNAMLAAKQIASNIILAKLAESGLTPKEAYGEEEMKTFSYSQYDSRPAMEGEKEDSLTVQDGSDSSASESNSNLMRNYNDCAYSIQGLKRDVKAATLLLENVEDKKSYPLNINQISAIQKGGIADDLLKEAADRKESVDGLTKSFHDGLLNVGSIEELSASIFKSLGTSVEELNSYFDIDIEKGRKGQVGEIRTWQGKKMKKEADGSWKPVGEGSSKAKKEEGDSSGKKKDDKKRSHDKFMHDGIGDSIKHFEEGRKNTEKEPDDFVETGGSGRTKKEILADLDKHISELKKKQEKHAPADSGDIKGLGAFKKQFGSQLTDKQKEVVYSKDATFTFNPKFNVAKVTAKNGKWVSLEIMDGQISPYDSGVDVVAANKNRDNEYEGRMKDLRDKMGYKEGDKKVTLLEPKQGQTVSSMLMAITGDSYNSIDFHNKGDEGSLNAAAGNTIVHKESGLELTFPSDKKEEKKEPAKKPDSEMTSEEHKKEADAWMSELSNPTEKSKGLHMGEIDENQAHHWRMHESKAKKERQQKIDDSYKIAGEDARHLFKKNVIEGDSNGRSERWAAIKDSKTLKEAESKLSTLLSKKNDKKSALEIISEGQDKSFAEDVHATYQENESSNNHAENTVLLAESFGTKSDVKALKEINKEHKKLGYLTPELSKKRYELQAPLYKKMIDAAKGGIKKSIGAAGNVDLIDTSLPNTAKPVEDFIALKKSKGDLVKKEITNKLGVKRIVYVKKD